MLRGVDRCTHCVAVNKEPFQSRDIQPEELSTEEVWRNNVINSFLIKLAQQTKENGISDEELERDYKFLGTQNFSFDGYNG